MEKNCVNCGEPNKGGWFYCRSCGQKASEPLYSTQFVIREGNPYATAIRKDQIDFRTEDMDTSVKRMQKQKWGNIKYDV
tara:strand:- start:108 stop:344 length:237 start_codon:yes stop_codon:yes gene_type:complete